MTGNEMILLAFAVMLVMLFAKVPVFIAVFSGSVIYFLLTPGVSIAIFAQKMIGGVESIPLLAVPFFVCASAFMNYSGVTERIYTFAGVLAGRMSGGLAQVNVCLLYTSNTMRTQLTGKIPYVWIYGIVPVSCVLMVFEYFHSLVEQPKESDGEELLL